MQRVSAEQIAQLTQTVDRLREQQTALSNLVTSNSQAVLDDISNKIQQMLGTGTNAIRPRDVRRGIQKIRRLQNDVNRLTQVCYNLRFESIYFCALAFRAKRVYKQSMSQRRYMCRHL